MTQDQLDIARHAAAEQEWIEYDLGEYQSEGQDGWQWALHGDEFARRIYVSSDGDAPSEIALFRVRFIKGTAEVAAAYASLDGSDIGCGGVHRTEGEDHG